MQSETPIFLTICRQDKRKGIPCLLAAYRLLNDKKLRYEAVIAGGGSQLKHNRTFAKKLSLTNVTWTGYTESITPLLAAAYCFVFPTLEEGSGSIALLEAMAAGLPVISTNVDGIGEDIEDGVSGLLVPPSSPRALAAAIEKLVGDHRLARRLGRAAHKRFAEKYSEEAVRQSLNKLLTPFDIAR